MEERRSPILSFGIIGAGEIVAKAHLPVLEQVPEVKIGWIADVNIQRASQLARQSRAQCISIAPDQIQLPPADVVLLAIPYGSRSPYYTALHDLRCAMYVEKPFARTVAEHQRLCDLIPDYSLACGLQRRSLGSTQLIRTLIAEDCWGPVRAARFEHGGPGMTVGGKYHSDLQLAGGGPLFEMGVHGIDAVLFCLQASEVHVGAVEMVMDQGFDLHTHASLAVSDRAGHQVPVEVIVSCIRETSNTVQFDFDRVSVSYSLFSDRPVRIRPHRGRDSYYLAPQPNRLYPRTVYQTLHAHWTQFLKGLRDKRANWTSASESLLTTEVIERAYAAGTRSSLTTETIPFSVPLLAET